jgi:hypothetical protein
VLLYIQCPQSLIERIRLLEFDVLTEYVPREQISVICNYETSNHTQYLYLLMVQLIPTVSIPVWIHYQGFSSLTLIRTYFRLLQCSTMCVCVCMYIYELDIGRAVYHFLQYLYM